MVEGKASKEKGGNKKMMGWVSGARRYYHICSLKFLSLCKGKMTEMNAQVSTEWEKEKLNCQQTL